MNTWLRAIATVVALSLILCSPVVAAQLGASGWLDEVRVNLYSGRIKEAESTALARVESTVLDRQAYFALGAARFLLAVEHLGQGLYRYGLQNTHGGGLLMLPILRLPIPTNPAPEPVSYEALRLLLMTFVADLKSADEALNGAIPTIGIGLSFDLARIRLDLNGDGTGSEDELLWRLFSVIAGMRTTEAPPALEFDFDGGDLYWLRAYCHLLMAVADLPLGYDWQEAYDSTFHSVFPRGSFPMSDWVPSTSELLERLQELEERPLTAPPSLRESYGNRDLYRETFRRWSAAEEERRLADYDEFWSLTRLRESGIAQAADLIAFVHLMHWPVVDEARLKDVVKNLQLMVSFSRSSWTSIVAEADRNREWIPNTKQAGGLPGLAITQERIDSWLALLDQLDRILAGTLLVPHWRFEQGINLRRFFHEPRPLDPILVGQGIGAIPYLEDGPKADPSTWSSIMRVFGGDLLRYFIYFN